MAKDTQTKKNIVPMILKTFQVLEAFRENPDGLTYMELINRYPNISRISVYRILCSLEDLGYLNKNEETNHYQLGAKFIELGKITERHQDILRIALPYMERVLQKYDENVNLYKIERGELIVLDTLECSHPLRVMEMRNRRTSVHSSATGKAIMAYLPEREAEELIDSLDMRKLTPNTISSKKALTQELNAILRQGFAYDNEENLIGVRCVGAAIRNHSGYPIAGLSVTAPAMRMPQAKLDEIGHYLFQIANEITENHLRFK